jgi:hypothetical protein
MAEIKAEAMRVLTGMSPMLDSDDPNDNAFKLVSINFVLCHLFFTKKTFPMAQQPQPDHVDYDATTTSASSTI